MSSPGSSGKSCTLSANYLAHLPANGPGARGPWLLTSVAILTEFKSYSLSLSEDVLERVLESLQDDFLKFVVAKAIAHKAVAKKIIPQTVETLILNAGDWSSANHFLFAHLRSQATVKDLRELCSIMKEAEGNSKMNGFGSKLEAELDKVSSYVTSNLLTTRSQCNQVK